MARAGTTPQSQEPEVRVLSTLNEDGSRRWIKPRPSSGRFAARRRAVAYGLILLFTLIPYLRMNGKPLMLLDLSSRRFTFFGYTFLPTDTLLLALLLVGVFVSIFLLTALFGRVWCGWACPQTVYMEFVFRPIERLFEGTPGRAKKGLLAGRPFSKPVKYAAYVLVSVYLAHTFLAYFVGVEQLSLWVTRSPLEHPTPFLVMLAVTGLMMFDFSFFREQTCIVACPYGRFQSALLDRDSVIVSYDRTRGEPRGKARRPLAGEGVSLPVVNGSAPPAAQGDCVDCGMCVQTCPTGIDIRDGLQMECISCTQCIDACDAVMTKLHRPRGLIRYTSQAQISGERRRVFRPRIIVYPTILLLVLSAFVITLLAQGPADVTILRGVGRPFVELPGGDIGNPVKIKITNRTAAPAQFTVEAQGTDGVRLSIEENPVRVAPAQVRVLTGMIAAPRSAFHEGEGVARVVVSGSAPEFRREVTYRLMGPAGHHKTRAESSHEDPSHKPDEPKEPNP